MMLSSFERTPKISPTAWKAYARRGAHKVGYDYDRNSIAVEKNPKHMAVGAYVLLEHKYTSSCSYACSLLAHKWLGSVRHRFVLSSQAPAPSVCVRFVYVFETITIFKPNETNKLRHVCSALCDFPEHLNRDVYRGNNETTASLNSQSRRLLLQTPNRRQNSIRWL